LGLKAAETLSGLHHIFIRLTPGCRAVRSNPGLELANAFGVKQIRKEPIRR
jgi:hypothetical protein